MRFAQSKADLEAAQQLRHRCLITDAGLPARADGRETDRFDALCDHVLVEDAAARLLCCCRVLLLGSGAELDTSYAAQFYDLSRLSGYEAPMVELGRFCLHPDVADGDVLRLCWGMLAAFVDAWGAGMLFGCSSFEGTDAARYADAFDLLAAQHLASDDQAPQSKAAQIVPYAQKATPVQDRRAALSQLPNLLKTYLTMGGWVSDHAVIDSQMNTLHVFTGLEIAAVPPARAAALRAIVT